MFYLCSDQRVKILGKGGFGITYLVQHKRKGTYKVWKILKVADNRLSFEQINESYYSREIDSPYVVKIEETYFNVINRNNLEIRIIMEYCNSGDLTNIISNNPNQKMEYNVYLLNYLIFLSIFHKELSLLCYTNRTRNIHTSH